MADEAADPVAWLRAQVAARLALARGASEGTDGHWWRRMADVGYLDDGPREPVGPLWAGEPALDADGDVYGGEEIVVYDEGRPSDVQFDHIAANDPQDTIARCEAELAILDACIPGENAEAALEAGDISAEEYATGEAMGAGIVRLLLAAYKHRSGYDERWSVPA